MAGPYSEHGRIESRTRRIFRGEELIADKDKWGGNLTVIEILTSTEKKDDDKITSYFRFLACRFNTFIIYCQPISVKYV